MRIVVEMAGPARGKGKGFPVATKDGLRIAPSAHTAKYQHALGFYAEKVMDGRAPIEGACSVTIEIRVKIPKALSKRDHAAALAREIFPTTKPDWDNYAKIIGDAFNEVVWVDDKQVVRGVVEKVYAEHPGITVIVETIEPPLFDQPRVLKPPPTGPLFTEGHAP